MVENIITAVGWSIRLFSMTIVVYALLSWIPQARDSRLDQLLHQICDPYLNIFRKFIPPISGMDFSPVVGIIVLQLLGRMF